VQLEWGLWQLFSCCEKVDESSATPYEAGRSAGRELANIKPFTRHSFFFSQTRLFKDARLIPIDLRWLAADCGDLKPIDSSL